MPLKIFYCLKKKNTNLEFVYFMTSVANLPTFPNVADKAYFGETLLKVDKNFLKARFCQVNRIGL